MIIRMIRRIIHLLLLCLSALFGAYTVRAQTIRWNPIRGALAVDQMSEIQLIFEDCLPVGQLFLPAIDGLSIDFADQSTSTDIINFSRIDSVTFTYAARLRKKQSVTIPSFEVETNKGKFRTPVATLDLVSAILGGTAVASDNASTSGLVELDGTQAVNLYRNLAEHGNAGAQQYLGLMYRFGDGVPKDIAAAVKWYRKSAEQGNAGAQYNLGFAYRFGDGVIKDEIEAYKWYLLAGAQGLELAKRKIPLIESEMTTWQRAEGLRLARTWKPPAEVAPGVTPPSQSPAKSRPVSSGTGFFITDDGYLITNQHVAGKGSTVRVLTVAGAISAKVVKVDKANDIALLKVEGKFTALPVIASRGVRLGATVATVGFPNIGLQGFSPKLAKGDIASLAGVLDDARHFQISVPIQPGNSGGALVDERGNVVGVVVAALNQNAAIAASGTLAQNVNYAVKSSYLMSFLEAVPAVAEKLKEPNTKDRNFEDVVNTVEQSTVLVLVH